MTMTTEISGFGEITTDQESPKVMDSSRFRTLIECIKNLVKIQAKRIGKEQLLSKNEGNSSGQDKTSTPVNELNIC